MKCPECGSEMEDLFDHHGRYASSFCRKCYIQKIPGIEGYYTEHGHEEKPEVEKLKKLSLGDILEDDLI
jgi:hypothetical protein